MGFTALLAGVALIAHWDPTRVLNGVLTVGLTTVVRDFLIFSQGKLKRSAVHHVNTLNI